jgi:hypothetical protein
VVSDKNRESNSGSGERKMARKPVARRGLGGGARGAAAGSVG